MKKDRLLAMILVAGFDLHRALDTLVEGWLANKAYMVALDMRQTSSGCSVCMSCYTVLSHLLL